MDDFINIAYENLHSKFKIRDIFIYHRSDIVKKYGAKYFRDIVHKSIDKVVSCNTMLMGHVVFKCPTCWKEHITFCTCKCRFCNCCAKVQSDLRTIKLLNWIPQNIGHHHIVLTIPKDLRDFFERHRDALSVLPKTAYECLDFCIKCGVVKKDPKHKGKKKIKYKHKERTVWAIAVIHTFWSDIGRNPHVHLLISHWYFNSREKSFVSDKFYLPIKKLRKIRTKMLILNLKKRCDKNLSKSQAYYAKKELDKFWDYKNYKWELIDWYWSISKEIFDISKVIWYIGRYLKRPPIAESHIIDWDRENNTITFIYKNKRTNKLDKHTFSIEEFIIRLVKHIPNEYFHMIYYYGIYSNFRKKDYLPIIKNQFYFKVIMPRIAKYYYQRFSLTLQQNSPLFCKSCNKQLIIYSVTLPNWFTKYFHDPSMFAAIPP